MIAGGALLIRSRHDALSSDNKGKTTAVNLLLITGSGLVLTSPFMFIASGRNKRIAMSLSLRNESVPTLRKTNYAYQTIPALSVKMGF
jgi:hypothetical protein